MKKSIPYLDLSYQHKPIKKEVFDVWEKCFDESAFILGKYVSDFETAFGEYAGAKHVIGVSNGTTALHLALLALNIGPGDEVITTPFTFAATAWAISYVGAKPVFVDVDPDNFTICPEAVEDAITRDTKAILPVHLFGHPCDMDPLIALCKHYKLGLVEDAAQSHGARYKNQQVGSFGDITTYSFYPAKNLGACGEAGAITTDNDALADRMRLLRSHGSRKRYEFEEVGYNYRMEGMQGAVLEVKLKYLNKWNLERIRLAALYHSLLQETSLRLPKESLWAESVYHLYSVFSENREEIRKQFDEDGIGYSMHYAKPMHLQECYGHLGYEAGSLPVAELLSNQVLNLPLYPGLKDDEVVYVADSIKRALKS